MNDFVKTKDRLLIGEETVSLKDAVEIAAFWMASTVILCFLIFLLIIFFILSR